MPGEQSEQGDLRNTSALESQTDWRVRAESDTQVAEAFARVQEAVIEMRDGELQESLEAAIEAIDSAAPAASDQLGPVADALEGALDELERGKVANLLPIIEQAQSIVQSESSGL
jgi:hypothetical protein